MKKLMIINLLFLISFSGFSDNYCCVTTQEFSEIIKSRKDVVIVDCDRPANYATSHVKGAINIWQQDIFVKEGPEGIMKSPDELAKFFGSKGLTESTPVVLYDDGSNKYTSRIWYVLNYLGAKDVKIVSRISSEWEKFRITMTTASAKLPAKTFAVTPRTDMYITIPEYKTKMATSKVLLVDTRNAEEFVGADKDKKSNGHLPGAINISHKDFLNADGTYKNSADMAALANKYGITPETEVVVYCFSGVRAAVGYLALREVLGYQNVKVMEGGYNHWVLDNANQLEK
jgi:thiosulfate/3-mercaptopyruvate sulfurtransferase